MNSRLLTALFLILFFSILAPQVFPYEIGHTTITFNDPDRNNRAIQTEIYYPAEQSGNDVPVATPEGDGFPAVAFGHGYIMVWSAYQNVWEAVVPEGYIAMFPRTEGELFPDHLDFGLDLAFLVDAMQAEGEDSTSIFFEKVASTSAVSGHSMGGGASVLAAEANLNATAVFNLAAAETDPSAIAAAGNVTIPALLFAGSDDCVTPPEDHQIPFYNAFASDCKTYIEIIGASHCQFAEYNFNCSLGEIFCPSPGITRSQQHQIVNTYLIPWLDFALKDDLYSWYQLQALLISGDDITYQQECDISSELSIEMIPDNPPVIVPAGGSFTFTGILTNNTAQAQTTDVWIMIDVPNYGLYGPVKRFNNIPLSPNQIIDVDGINQAVPMNTPAGDYNYNVYCGDYPTSVVDLATFPFTVTGTAQSGSEDWVLSGWALDEIIPGKTVLVDSYPNPFNAITTINYQILEVSPVKLDIFNLLGQKVATLVDAVQPVGKRSVQWDASNYSSGIYFYKLSSGDKVYTKRMTLLK
ncbi:MAG: T9SS type A sorting domain-containing protein [candidate division Zixibacteria bacterium]|nr:T9SS type A sorting domain-containing protein [candidate division Zixibacteria bacterium]